jgi:hypothetical protein
MHTIESAAKLIESGAALLTAGTERALAALPRGRWIGGTIPYFMTEDGGVEDSERVFVTELPEEVLNVKCRAYGQSDIHQVAANGSSHGFTVLIVPAFSEVHRAFAQSAPEFPDAFMKPLVGWVAGVGVSEKGKVAPKAFLGTTGESFAGAAVAMHAELHPSVFAKIDIVNIFRQGRGPQLQFESTGFTAVDCLVEGERHNLAGFIADQGIDTRLPLVADFCGAMINTSIAGIDAATGSTSFYAPVFPEVKYRFAEPVGDYVQEFARRVPRDIHMTFSCNCIMNYLHGKLKGKPLSGTAGPITFGEIAYQLLNQTLVYLELVRS